MLVGEKRLACFFANTAPRSRVHTLALPLSYASHAPEMDPNLHVKQAVNHLERVLDYAPMVAEDGQADVHLTTEDWHVVNDALFKMDTPDEALPDAIRDYERVDGSNTIRLTTEDYVIDVDIVAA